MQKLIRKTLLLSERQIIMMEEVQKKNGIPSFTGVIHMAITKLYDSTFKYGADPLVGSLGSEEHVEKKAEFKVKVKQAEDVVKENLKLAPKVSICQDVLKGEVVTNPDGTKICKWINYSTIGNDEEQSVALQMVGEYLTESQFIPSKQSVLKARPELRKIFEPKEQPTKGRKKKITTNQDTPDETTEENETKE